MSWRAGLDGYTTNGLDPICKFWFGKLSGHKESRQVALARLLDNAATVAGAVATWPAPIRQAIAIAGAHPGADPERLIHEIAAAGLEDAPALVSTLFTRGVLFPATPRSTPDDAARGHTALVMPPAFASTTEAFHVRPAAFPPVPDASVLAVEVSEGDSLAAAAGELIRLGDRGKLSLLVSGLPSKASLVAIRKAVAPYPRIDGALVFQAAVAARMFKLDPLTQRAVPAAAARDLHPDLWPRVLTLGMTGPLSWWIDDHTAQDDGHLSEWLRADQYDELKMGDLAGARSLLLGIVRRLPNNAWFRADSIVDEAIRLLDTVGFRLANLAHHRWGGARPRGASDCARQRTALSAIVSRTLPGLGLLDVGSTAAGPIAPPSRRDAPRQLDNAFQSRDDRDPKKPRWSPTPSTLVVRRTAVGEAVLGIAPTARKVSPSIPAGAVLVGADFEVVAPRDALPAKLRTALDRLAVAAPLGPHDPVRRWRIERERWTNAAQSGVDGAGTLAELARLSGRPAPANVVDTTGAWTASFERVRAWMHHELVEWASTADREAALASVSGAERVGTRFALVPAGRVQGVRLDVSAPPLRVLQASDDGTLRILGGLDLFGRALVDRIAPPGKDGVRRLDREALTGSDVAAWRAELEPRLRAPMALGFEARLRGWSGGLGGARTASVEVLQFASVAEARLATSVPEVQACVALSLGAGMVIVKPKRMAELRKVLAGLGIGVETGLVIGAAD